MLFALSSLDLYLESEDRVVAQDDNPNPGFSVFRTASNLQTLTLCSDSIMPASRVLQFPLHRITTLTLISQNLYDAELTYENLQTILPSLVNIEACMLASFDFILDPTKPRLTLPRLRFLTLVTGKASAIDAFLESVTLPSLSTLHISPQSSLPFIQFLQRSSCPIEVLGLVNATDDVLIEVLKAQELQGTKYLFMTSPGDNNQGRSSMNSISDGVLRVLMFRPNGEILFPRLWALTLPGTK
ncbi:hypothetical protein AAF712_007345 [Marasmius tenuissimus]|uniref:Uncharacterized protein n=1 Tax=Marasmius tenuissimus TaxID=585030 RepID=A0ABR2ZX11_9AGAR